MKNMKSKLLASVAMLLVSAIMLTSASFAWFTISTAPEVKGITTTVVTNETLEIALDKQYEDEDAVDAASTYDAEDNSVLTGNYYTWGNLVNLAAEKDKTNAAAAAYADLDKTLRPATLLNSGDDDSAFTAPTYGADGRIQDMENGLTAAAGTGAAVNGFGLLVDEDKLVYGYYIDYWMRSNVGGQVVLAAADTSVDGTADNTGDGSTFTANAPDEDATEDEEKALQKINEVLAANIHIAFQDVTPDEEGERTAGIITKATTKPVATAKETATFEGDVTTLEANVAKLVRVYVYLEGENVTNESASIDGQIIGGSLNLQFTIAADESKGVNGVDTSMLTEQTTVEAEEKEKE